MGVVEGLGHRRHQSRRIPVREGRLLDPVRQVAPLDELGDDVAEAVLGTPHVVDRDDARVVEPGDGAGLGQIRLDVLGAGDPLGVGAP